MGNSAARKCARTNAESWSLFTATGRRKYPTQRERLSALAAFQQLPADRCLFALTLAWSGARVSEILALTPASFDLDSSVATIRTLKRRRVIVREVPLPPELVASLDRVFALRAAQLDRSRAEVALWRFCRTTAWRFIKQAMIAAGVQGRPACPRGLRHGFGVGTLQAGVPLTLLQRWLGHAHLRTTAIYADVSGPEERAFASRFWQWTEEGAS